MSYTNIMSSSFGSSSQDHSLSAFPLNEEDHVLTQRTLNDPSFTPAGTYDLYGQQQYFNACYQQQQQQQQHALQNTLPVNYGLLNQAPQPEYFGHNLVCAPYSCYGGMTGAYGQPIAQPQSMDVPPRILLVPETGPEPVYVNPKQYDAILRRRASRAKQENEKKLIKTRKPYIHESRHLHAKNRPRGTGGRFSKKGEIDSSNTAASSSSQRVQPKPFETPRQSNHESPSYHFLSLDLGDEYLNISSPNQGLV